MLPSVILFYYIAAWFQVHSLHTTLTFRKLHCQRNKLHMHLFASFILKIFLTILKDVIFVDGVGLRSDIKYKNGSSYFFVDTEVGASSARRTRSIITHVCFPVGKLDVQIRHQFVGVLHFGELLLDPDGGPLPAQSHFQGPVRRLQQEHSALHSARVG